MSALVHSALFAPGALSLGFPPSHRGRRALVQRRSLVQGLVGSGKRLSWRSGGGRSLVMVLVISGRVVVSVSLGERGRF